MVLLLLASAAFVIGMLPTPRWTAAVLPGACLVLGAYWLATVPETSDMPLLGFYAGGVMALVSATGWLLGRGVSSLVRR